MVVVAGGRTEDGDLSDLTEIYDGDNDQWLVGPTTSFLREGIVLIPEPNSDTIYAFGGDGLR